MGHSFFDHQLMWQRCIICPAFTLVELTYAAMGKMASRKCVLLLLRWGRASQCKRSSLLLTSGNFSCVRRWKSFSLSTNSLSQAEIEDPAITVIASGCFHSVTQSAELKKKSISEVKMQNRTWVGLNRPDATLIADEYLHFPFVCWLVTSQLCNGLKTSSAACEL